MNTLSDRGATTRPAASMPTVFRVIAALLIGFGLFIAPAGVASAHTDFESSSPGDGEVVTGPVDTITITFTGEATPVGDEFVALDGDGQLRQPVEVAVDEGRIFTIRFDPPLSGGRVGVRWHVQAADSHPIEGAFSFTVEASLPSTTTTSTTTTLPTADTTAAVPTTAATDAASETGTTTGSATPDDETATNEPSDTVTDSAAGPATTAPDAADLTDSGTDLDGEPTSLDEFLAVADGDTPGEGTATAGRAVGFLGVAFGIGAFTFLATTLRGRRSEVTTTMNVVRVLGGVVIVGAAVEYLGVTRIGDRSLGDAWSTSAGFATVLRALGGLAIAAGLGGAVTALRRRRPDAGGPSPLPLSAAPVAAEPGRTSVPSGDDLPDAPVRWIPDPRSWIAIGGVVAIVASFWFDGHTVTEGFRPLHAAVNSVHVVAGSIWVGGVAALATVVWVRHRSGRPMRLVELVLRFSRIATVALVAVIAAGAVMALLVLDGFGELTSTTWGQVLLLKTSAVGLAAIGGAVNHFVLLPALEADPESSTVLARLRSTLTAEAIVLGFVVVVTAWLVAAATT